MKISSKKAKIISYIMLFVIIALQLFRIIYSFACLKEDYHSDEQWSFGLSNSYYDPNIYIDDNYQQIENYEMWLSPDLFKNYITVDNDHRFSYGSVFYNQSKDMHPPLFYLILHTICSFFPGKFSYWYGFPINIVSFIILQIFLFKTAAKITKSNIAAVSACLFYGTTTGCLNTFVFVRMYALMTMFTVISLYLHTNIYYERNLKKNLPALFIITTLGCLTNHFFPIYACAMSACFCFMLLLKKEYKNLIVYAISLLLAAVTSVIIFPATITHLASPLLKGVHYSTGWQIKMCISLITSELFGFSVSIFSSATPSIILVGFIFIIIILSPLLFLFRKKINFSGILTKVATVFRLMMKKINLLIVFMIISALVPVIITAVTVSMVRMSLLTDRYLFFVYPIVCIAFICTVYHLLQILLQSKKTILSLTATIALVFSLVSNLNCPCAYLFEKIPGCLETKSVINDSNCIFITNEQWVITYMCDIFSKCNSVFPSYIGSTFEDNIKLPDQNHPAYLIVNTEIYKNMSSDSDNNLEKMLGGTVVQNSSTNNSEENSNLCVSEEELIDFIETSTERKCEYIGYDSYFGRLCNIYKLN